MKQRKPKFEVGDIVHRFSARGLKFVVKTVQVDRGTFTHVKNHTYVIAHLEHPDVPLSLAVEEHELQRPRTGPTRFADIALRWRKASEITQSGVYAMGRIDDECPASCAVKVVVFNGEPLVADSTNPSERLLNWDEQCRFFGPIPTYKEMS